MHAEDTVVLSLQPLRKHEECARTVCQRKKNIKAPDTSRTATGEIFVKIPYALVCTACLLIVLQLKTRSSSATFIPPDWALREAEPHGVSDGSDGRRFFLRSRTVRLRLSQCLLCLLRALADVMFSNVAELSLRTAREKRLTALESARKHG